MLRVYKLVFNVFQENTYIIAGQDGSCIIVDPGCSNDMENKILETFINEHHLNPIQLILTHFHLDHVFGNKFVNDTWGLLPTGHQNGSITLGANEQACKIYGLPYIASPPISHFLAPEDVIHLSGEEIQVIFVPGHSVGHIALVCISSQWVISGDVLFNGSIGRTDLPGGDLATLTRSIQDQMYHLPDAITVYSGHGPETTIGAEKKTNPFVRP